MTGMSQMFLASALPAASNPFYVPSASLLITGQAPTVRVPIFVQGVTGAVVLTGQAPSVPVPGFVQAPSATITLTGQAPTVSLTSAVRVTGATGAVTVTGRAPIAFTTLRASKSGDASGTCYHSVAAGSCTVTTNSVTATASGGVAPYSYSWSYVSGTSATVNSPSSATTTFSRSGTGNNTYNGTYRCTITDSGGRTATVDVTVSSTYYYNAPTISSYFSPTSGATGTPYTVYWSSTDATSVAWSNSGADTSSGTFGTTSGNASGTITWTGTIYQTHTATGPGGTAYAYLNITGTGSPLSATKSGDASGSGYAPNDFSMATTNTVTITPSGGTAPYSYSWSRISGATNQSISSATSASVTWSSYEYGSSGGDTYTSVWRCTVTDNASHTTTVDVTVETTHWID